MKDRCGVILSTHPAIYLILLNDYYASDKAGGIQRYVRHGPYPQR